MAQETAALSLVHLVRPPVTPPAPGERAPLLVLLHGVGGNEEAMLAIAPAMDPRFLIVSARGPHVMGPRAFGWFHVTFTPQGPAIAADEAAASWAAIARFVDEAVAAYEADPGRVHLAGFSQGAIMGLATLLTAPERVAGVVAMSGRLLPEVLPHAAPDAALDGKAVLIVHGVDDQKLGVHYARGARETLARFPLRLDYRELPMGHAMTSESVAEVARWLSARLVEPPAAR
ncbi:alpha/beta hydrolase [Roseisolibacter agri]|uniref:Phospholipase n=1 Tax=Roseisolibacter agri TaxID=2014610 RepID=A0AA37QEH4_9BACT|nr:alpha/beta fold hydrolase [Roseisolibacter agri]GLC24263.1 phospholipase [Roseisolibacter agri]